MQVEVTIGSGKNLKNVNWRNGELKPYAVVWIDSSPKCTTKVDTQNDENPMWEEKFSLVLPPTSRLDTAVLYVDIVHVNAGPGVKPLVGSAQLPFRDVLNEAQSGGKALRSLKVKRPSGRPHGKLEVKIVMKDQMPKMDPYGQPAYYGAYAPPPQAAPAPHQYPYRGPAPPQQAYNSPGYSYAAPPVQAYGGGYNAPAPVKAKPPVQAYGGGGYNAPAPIKEKPPVQVYGGGYGPAPVKDQKKDKNKDGKHKDGKYKDKDSQYGVGTGLAVGAAAGLIGGLVIADALDNNNNQPQVIVENVQYVNETNVYETNNTYESTEVYESNDTYETTNVYDDGGDGGYDDGGDGDW